MNVRLLVVLVIALMASNVFGQFTLESGYPSGGTSTVYLGGPPSPYNVTDYASLSGGYYGFNSSGCINAGGRITYKFLWTGNSWDEPQKAVCKITCSAVGRGVGSMADDGIGDPSVYHAATPGGPEGYTSDGVKYSIETAIDHEIVVRFTPAAKSFYGNCSVSVKVEIIPIKVTVIGLKAGTNHCLLGQKISCSVSAPGVSLSNPHWDNPSYDDFAGTIWGAVIPSSETGNTAIDAHHYLALTSTDLTSDTLTFFIGSPDVQVLTCYVDIRDATGGWIGQASASAQIVGDSVTNSIDITPGVTSLKGSVSGPTGLSVDSPSTQMAYSATTPSPFVYGVDQGVVSLVQLAKLNRYQYRYLLPGQYAGIYNGSFCIDTTWPYDTDNGWTSADGSIMSTEDSPGGDFFTGVYYTTFFHAADQFQDFVTYRPPLGDSLATEYVPLQMHDWNWSIDVEQSSPGGDWPSPPGGNPLEGSLYPEYPYDRFVWSAAIEL